MKSIADIIKSEMEAQGMTYEHLASECGITRQNLWIRLNKVYCPNFENAQKMLNALGVQIEIKKKENAAKEVDQKSLFRCLEEKQISYEDVETILNEFGYEIALNGLTQYSE
ncbi:MAG: helix-turn-helix transcriptional regulator [Eubacteriales bacterium]|nr:helix-turn-helix transcriptional regulator [Eubacteriales bacterium]